jgi:hypothetical protein
MHATALAVNISTQYDKMEHPICQKAIYFAGQSDPIGVFRGGAKGHSDGGPVIFDIYIYIRLQPSQTGSKTSQRGMYCSA